MERFVKMTQHHKISQAYGGLWQPANIVRLQEHVHQAFHTVFDCKTPIQQMRKILEDSRIPMSMEAYQEISDVLVKFEGIMEVYAYDPKCFDSGIFLKRLHKEYERQREFNHIADAHKYPRSYHNGNARL